VEGSIIKNIRFIEHLKCGVLQEVAQLFRALFNGPEKLILDALSNLILYSYLLGNRVGISFHRLDHSINDKARLFLKREQEVQEQGIPPEDLLLFMRYRETHKK